MTEHWLPEFNFKDLEIISTEKKVDGYLKLSKQAFRFKYFDGSWSPIISRDLLDKSNASAVLIYSPDQDAVVFIEQCRPAITDCETVSPWILDIVAGVIDGDASPAETALREAKEEAGISIDHLIPIIEYLPSCGYSNEKTSVYCGIVRGQLPNDGKVFGLKETENEDIKVHIMSSEIAFTLLSSKVVLPASAAIALFWLKANKEKILTNI